MPLWRAMNNKSMSDTPDAKTIRDGAAARELLAHPLIEGFFRSEHARCYNAFKALPMEAAAAQYTALRAYVEAVERLQRHLQEYVEAGDMARARKLRPRASPGV